MSNEAESAAEQAVAELLASLPAVISPDQPALSAFDRVVRVARSRGYFVRAAAPTQLNAPLFSNERIGDAPVIATPGQDVGSGARRSFRDPQPLGDILSALVKRRGWSRQMTIASLYGKWGETVGPALAAHSRIASFSDDGILEISVDPGWDRDFLQLLHFVHQRLNEVVGEDLIREIVVSTPPSTSRRGRSFSTSRSSKVSFTNKKR